MRVAGLGYSDGARNLEVMLESLSGGRRREIQEDGIVMEVKKILFWNILEHDFSGFFKGLRTSNLVPEWKTLILITVMRGDLKRQSQRCNLVVSLMHPRMPENR